VKRKPRWRVRLALAALALAALGPLTYRQAQEYRARAARAAGEAAATARDFGTAAEAFERAAALRPDDSDGWFRAARAARRAGRFPDAKRLLAEAATRGHPTEPVELERELLLVQQGIIGTADARLRATVGPRHPDAALVLEALARGYVIAERWADARQACEMWRGTDPTHPWPWHWEGLIAERMIQPELAAVAHARALELDPSDPAVRLAVARVALDRRSAADALPHIEWVLARTPDDAAALLLRAQHRVETGRAAEAVPALDALLARDPNGVPARVLRARAALELNDPATAEAHLRAAVRAAPGDGDALALLLRAVRAQNKGAEAADLAVKLAALEADLRRLTDLMRQIGTKTADGGPCHEAGVLALKVGRERQGLNYLADALRRPGDHRATHGVLAEYFRSRGKFELAEFHKNQMEGP
jgi:Tfp pilus assembly protein PilF